MKKLIVIIAIFTSAAAFTGCVKPYFIPQDGYTYQWTINGKPSWAGDKISGEIWEYGAPTGTIVTMSCPEDLKPIIQYQIDMGIYPITGTVQYEDGYHHWGQPETWTVISVN